jgi:glutamate 5-kinase
MVKYSSRKKGGILMDERGTVVVKVGSSTLTYDTGKLHFRRIEKLTRVLSDLKNSGRKIVLVSSGAVAAGLAKMGQTRRPDTLAGKQAAAAVGQSELMSLYDRFFSEYHQIVAQLLLTRDTFDHDTRRGNAANTLCTLLEKDILPIVNENDTVSIEDLVVGDNDTLSAMVAELVGAQLLIILTDIDGLYDANPAAHPDARLIKEVQVITPEIQALAGDKGSAVGTGGMATKLTAAQIAADAGIPTVIANGNDPENIYRILAGEPVGTRIMARREAGCRECGQPADT